MIFNDDKNGCFDQLGQESILKLFTQNNNAFFQMDKSYVVLTCCQEL